MEIPSSLITRCRSALSYASRNHPCGMLGFFFLSFISLFSSTCFGASVSSRAHLSLSETNIVVTRRDKSDVVERRSSRTKVNDVRQRGHACAISSLRIIELAWTSALARLRQVRGLRRRGSTVVITGRGAPIKKSISFLDAVIR